MSKLITRIAPDVGWLPISFANVYFIGRPGGKWIVVDSGLPGSRAVAIASLRRSTAIFSAAVTSVTVCDTSVAVSIARSAMLGCNGVSLLTMSVPADPHRHPPKADGFMLEMRDGVICSAIC